MASFRSIGIGIYIMITIISSTTGGSREPSAPKITSILIAGCTDPPEQVNAVTKSSDCGSYLQGTQLDMAYMEDLVKRSPRSFGELFDSLRMMNSLQKGTVLERIRQCAQRPTDKINIYYTGHGQSDTGDWCFADGTLTLKQVIGAIRSSEKHNLEICILADCCFAGNWCSDLEAYKDTDHGYISVHAACPRGQVAWDTKEGSKWTLWMTGKKQWWNSPGLKNCEGCVKPGKFKYSPTEVFGAD